MGRAIAFLTFLVFCSFTFVVLQVLRSRPADAMTAHRAAPILVSQDDGSVVALDLKFARLERRLMDEEKRSGDLHTHVQTLQEERASMEGQVRDLQAEVRRLRKQLSDQAQAPEQPETAPAATDPPSALPQVPTQPQPLPQPADPTGDG